MSNRYVFVFMESVMLENKRNNVEYHRENFRFTHTPYPELEINFRTETDNLSKISEAVKNKIQKDWGIACNYPLESMMARLFLKGAKVRKVHVVFNENTSKINSLEFEIKVFYSCNSKTRKKKVK